MTTGTSRWLPTFVVLALTGAACAQEPVVAPPVVRSVDAPARVRLERVFGEERFRRPVDACRAPGDEAWYVVEQHGEVWRVAAGADGWERRSFLDISDRVTRSGNEEGLLGLAFSPHHAEPGHPEQGAFYVNYSVRPGPLSRLSRLRVAGDGEGADPDGEEVLLEVEQPWRNHNGGGLLFGPDGYLYWSLGDGGLFGDPQGNGQDPGTLLGSILRLDPTRTEDGRAYAIPEDNPLIRDPGARPEVWAFGLRNVWRFSFDRATGELWAGDVGQNEFEWVHVVQPGGNHGWDLLEGFHPYELDADDPVPAGLVAPVFEYPHIEGISITGGYVYRGDDIPGLQGWYLFGDYATRHLWALRRLDDGIVEHATLLAGSAERPLITSFAEDRDGELLIVGHEGFVYRLLPAGDEP